MCLDGTQLPGFLHFAFADYRFERNSDIMLVPAHHAVAGALAGFLVFISLSNQVNYQYLIVYIPLAILLAATTKFKFERIFALAIAVYRRSGYGSIISHGGSIIWNPTSTGRTIF